MEKKKVLFYGAGEHGAMLYRYAAQKSVSYGTPVAFIDRDLYKQGHLLFDLPVISWEEAKGRYGNDFYIYITGNEMIAPEMLGFLAEQGVKQERIINYEPVEKRLGCGIAETFLCIRSIGETIDFCSCNRAADNLAFESVEDRFAVPYEKAASPEVVHKAVKFAQDSAQRIALGDREGMHTCCVDMRTQWYFKNRRLRTVNFTGTGPCNFKCDYCLLKHSDFKKINYQQYAVFTKILQQLESSGAIGSDAVMKVSSGEFSISEVGNHFVELAGKYPCLLLTNAYRYSPQAAKALENSGMILSSVDAGTATTFQKIKGVDGFEQVSENLRTYAQHGPVTLKYILLDGVNDTEADLEGFFALADQVATRIDFTRDFMDASARFSDRALWFAARFISHFRNQGKLNMSMSAFVRSGEKEKLDRFLAEVEKNG